MQAEDFIKEIYSKHPKPLYLSNLGSILKKNNLLVRNLREFVESMEGFTVACGPEKERTAIAAIEDKDEVEALLNERSDKIDPEVFRFLSKLPHTLLFAFASKRKAQPSVFVMTSPPFWFGFSKENESMVEIQNDLLLDAKIPLNLKQLDPGIASMLHSNIKRWIDSNNIPMSIFTKDMPTMHADIDITLLEEMINAIPPNQRSKVTLPLDIIGYLLKRR